MEGINSKNTESPKAKGLHIISICKIKGFEAENLQELLEEVRMKRERLIKYGLNSSKALRDLWHEYNFYLELLHKKFLTNQVCIENITTTVGRTDIAERLGGSSSPSGQVNYGALGTDNTAPVIGNTTLGTETFRKALSSGTNSANITFLENFYTASEVSGTFEEYGFFMDGTGTVDTGTLFNRFTTTVVKSNTESLNVQSTISWNDS